MTESEYDDACAAALNWLNSLPAGTTIGWNTHHFSPEWPFSRGWVDVFVPDLQQAAGWNWAWTVEEEDDPDHDEQADPFSLTAPFDAVLELHTDGGAHGWDEQSKNFRSGIDEARLLLPNGEPLTLPLNDDEDFWHFQRSRAVPGSSQDWLQLPVWTPHAISRALNSWVHEHSGRGDLSFRWDPEIPESEHVTRAKEMAAKLRAGEQVEHYQLGEAVYATDEAFDFLLGLPQPAAAAVTERLAEISRQLTDEAGDG